MSLSGWFYCTPWRRDVTWGTPGWYFMCTLWMFYAAVRVFHVGLCGRCLTRESTGRFDVCRPCWWVFHVAVWQMFDLFRWWAVIRCGSCTVLWWSSVSCDEQGSLGLVAHMCPSMALVCQVWQEPAVSGAAQLVTIVWPFTGDLRGGLRQIVQRGIRVTGSQHLGVRGGAARHQCLLALLVVLRTCIPWLDGSLAASLAGVRGWAGRLGPR